MSFVLLLAPLFVLTVLTIISMVSGNSLIGTSYSDTSGGSIIVNGSESTVYVENAMTIDVSVLAGIIALIIVIVVLVAIIGLQIVGSGLNSESVRAIFLGTVYTSLWVFLSFLSAGFIFSILYFGALIYLLLTIFYVIGVIRNLSGA